MDIVCAIDDNYVQHCCVMLTSFFENNKNGQHSIHLLTEGLKDENKNRVEHVVEFYQGTFFYYRIESNRLRDFPIKDTDHLSIATYYRLFITEILPSNLRTVLYLDCDIVINTSIQELWDLSLKEYAIAAVEELGCSQPDVFDRLEYDSQFGYFNAGVLLINLNYWRTHGLTKVFSDYIVRHPDKLMAHDQDVLNVILHKKCLHIPIKWNVEESFFHHSVIQRLKYNSSLLEALYNPAILHYTWKPKPWEDSCLHPLRINYFIYLQKVPGRTVIKSHLLFQKLQAYWDKYFFRFLIKLNITKPIFYRLYSF